MVELIWECPKWVIPGNCRRLGKVWCPNLSGHSVYFRLVPEPDLHRSNNPLSEE